MSRRVIVLTQQELENKEKLLPVIKNAWRELHYSTSAIGLMDTALYWKHHNEDLEENKEAIKLFDDSKKRAMEYIRKAQGILESLESLLQGEEE